MDGASNARVRAAATEISRQGIVDVGVSWRRIRREQRGGRHHLAGLTVAALRHPLLEPGPHDRMPSIASESLDCGDALARCRGDWHDARSHGGVVDVHRADVEQAKGHAATQVDGSG